MKHRSVFYVLGMGGTPDGVSKTSKDSGEWRVFVEKRRSMWQRVRGRGRISADDPMLMLVEQILRSESDFEDVYRED